MQVIRRLFVLGLVVILVAAGFWTWRRIHHADAPSRSTALAVVAAGGKAEGSVPVGVWAATQNGSSSTSLSVLSLKRTLPDSALLEIARSGRSLAMTWRFSAGTYDTFLIRESDRGLLAVGARMATTSLFSSSEASGSFPKSIMLIPKRLRVGTAWSATYPLGKSVVIRKSRVAGRATTTLPGAGAVWKIRVSEEWTGTTAAGSVEETIIWSPKLQIPLSRTVSRNLQGTLTENLTSTVNLSSVTPLAAN